MGTMWKPSKQSLPQQVHSPLPQPLSLLVHGHTYTELYLVWTPEVIDGQITEGRENMTFIVLLMECITFQKNKNVMYFSRLFNSFIL